jgi:ATP-dependent DNA helicase RecG
MSLPVNIAELIQQRVVESVRIEYKQDWNPEPILHSICAFANDIDNWGGGYIILGIEEENGIPKYPVPGLAKPSIERIQKELLQKCNLIEPRYLPVVEVTTYEEKDIIIIWCPGGDARPYKCPVNFPSEKSARWEKAYYIRKMSNTIRANQQEEQELFMLANNVPFDDRVNMTAAITDLKSSLISEFLHTVGSSLYEQSLSRPLQDVATDMRLLGGTKENRKPLNVALMFFNERPEFFFPYARIEVVDKPDPTGKKIVEKYFTGPLDRQLKDALSYIQNYILKSKTRKISGQAEAVRVFNIPFPAVEEALSNAIFHKSYQIGEPVTVTMTPDRMEILSLPGPDRTITNDDLKHCHLVSRRYRNRRIGDFLKELKLVEGRNTGIPTILKAMQDNGSKMPIFETDEERTFFSITLPVHEAFLDQNQKTKRAPFKSRRSLAEIKTLILKSLSSNGEMSASKLSRQLGYAKVTETFSRAVNELIEEGKIQRSHPEKLYNRNQRLRLKS